MDKRIKTIAEGMVKSKCCNFARLLSEPFELPFRWMSLPNMTTGAIEMSSKIYGELPKNQ